MWSDDTHQGGAKCDGSRKYVLGTKAGGFEIGRMRLFVKMSLMTTATTVRKIVPDVLEKRCHIALPSTRK